MLIMALSHWAFWLKWQLCSEQQVTHSQLLLMDRYGGKYHSPVKSVLWRNSGITQASQLPTDITTSMESELVTQPS